MGAAAPSAHAASPIRGAQASYLSLADRGIKTAQRLWWNKRLRWYNDKLNSHQRFPLATIWSIVPLWEAANALAIADHSGSRVKLVRQFAANAEKYFNRAMHGYGPYRGDRNKERVWFDDNGWWGLAFVDAWRATGDRKYLKDADKAFRFAARYGWASGGGMWWHTDHPYKSGEALGAQTLLGALLYKATRNSFYLTQVNKWLAWADANFVNGSGLYFIKDGDSSSVSYVEGPMVEAHQTLCEAGEANRCARARQLADASEGAFGDTLDHAPQFDTIYLRSMLAYYRATHDRRWYDIAVANAQRAQANARTGTDTYLAAWDGGSITAHQAERNMVQTQGATVELFAWLAATPPPSP